jgi:hypothetical protein
LLRSPAEPLNPTVAVDRDHGTHYH